ncbi:hypothetical protein CUZ56_00715 [Saezia sanguinis]|uniref:Surface-adhesin protein E-like domain-containing protein n=1 Tax=Saezia sanguinis TaxID=1965230 RepID=A0A433SHN0_9BURK|nr:surface-adhesin E family protein [Saezia sanguinis]RUS68228.1 hypothetical protein CUZ56_00715 [Saezia sanguinis]
MKKLALSMGLAALVLSACSTTGQPQGPDWQAYHNEGGFDFYVDKNSVKPVEGQTNWRSAMIAVQGGSITYEGQAAGSLAINITVDCAQQSGRSDRYAFYEAPLAQGKLLGEQAGYNEFKKAEIPADVAMLNVICK